MIGTLYQLRLMNSTAVVSDFYSSVDRTAGAGFLNQRDAVEILSGARGRPDLAGVRRVVADADKTLRKHSFRFLAPSGARGLDPLYRK